MTDLLFCKDAYLKTCEAEVVGITERGGVILDRTVFYSTAGGQPGDTGKIGDTLIATTIYDETKKLVHVPAEGQSLPVIGSRVTTEINWSHRYRIMRSHTMMHLLCASVPFPVTGGAIGDEGGRIDFDIPEGQVPDKLELTAKLNQLIQDNHPITISSMTEDELDRRPELIRTLLVKPPRGSGIIRLVLIGDGGKIDLQPCGGTHVNATAEVGPVVVSKIENKGKINRRIRVQLQNLE
jgi:misacylated tRNA(Ala) deacylase